MLHDNQGCRKVLLEGGVGCLVLVLSLLALVLLGLRAVESPGGNGEEATPTTIANELEEVLDEGLRAEDRDR